MHRDIDVMLHNSNGSELTSDQYKMTIDFFRPPAKRLTIYDPFQMRVASVQFSTYAVINWRLDIYYSADDMKTAIDNYYYLGDRTNMAAAFEVS